jgi:hypothetical protein
MIYRIRREKNKKSSAFLADFLLTKHGGPARGKFSTHRQIRHSQGFSGD